jgi:hypothetical protein
LKDTDERLKGKRGWGFKKNQSAYLSEETRSEKAAPKATEESHLSDQELSPDEGSSSPTPDLLPSPSDFDDADGLETLDVQ